jgi:hypothetical protein
LAIAAASVPGATFAQTSPSSLAGFGAGHALPVFSSGCSGSGPGIITGRVPGYGEDTMGFVRILAGDSAGDAFVSQLTQMEASKAWLMKTFGNAKSAAAYMKNPTSNPAAGQYHGSPTDTNAALAYLRQRNVSLQLTIQAAQAAKSMMLASDGSFSCGGVPSGKYHVVVTMNHIPKSAVLAGTNATGTSQTTLLAEVVVPPGRAGQKFVVPVTQFRELLALKK